MQSVRINMGRVSIFEKSLRFSHWTSTGPKNTFETKRSMYIAVIAAPIIAKIAINGDD